MITCLRTTAWTATSAVHHACAEGSDGLTGLEAAVWIVGLLCVTTCVVLCAVLVVGRGRRDGDDT